jgi:polar amino acid transport system substrate-binding protein
MVYPNQPLLIQDYVFFVRKNSPWKFNGQLASIAGARIGITRNVFYSPRLDQALKAGLFAAVDSTDSHESNLRKLLAGRVDIVPCSRTVALQLLQTMPGGNEAVQTGPSIEKGSQLSGVYRPRCGQACRPLRPDHDPHDQGWKPEPPDHE